MSGRVPWVTVLMAVHNGDRFIRTAIESILSQTYGDFLFRIIDDASTDGTLDVIRSYRDERIELVSLDKNVGQTAALNTGLRQSASPWIARMDADDFSDSRRLEVQIECLKRQPDVRCVGTAAWEFREDPQRREAVRFRPARHEEIWQAALHGSGMIHGSILVSREALLAVGGYDERYRYAADRELFIRLFPRYRATNLQEPLLGIRRHEQQDSFSLGAANEYIQIFQRHLASRGYPPMERTILRRSLAYSHLFRAGCSDRAGHIRKAWADRLQALGIAPETCARSLVGAILPQQWVTHLRGNFWSSGK